MTLEPPVQSSHSSSPGRTDGERNDWELLRAFIRKSSGADQAFETLVARHAAMVHGVCRRALHDRALADDAAQAVFLLFAQKASGLADKTVVAGWLYNTAVLVAKTMKEQRRVRLKNERKAAREHAASAETADSEQTALLRTKLDAALAQMSARDRNAIVLHYLEGLPQAQAAQAMGLSHDAYRQCLARALERLRWKVQSSQEVFASAALAAALAAIAAGDAQAVAAGAPAAWSAAALGKTTVSTLVQQLVEGVSKKMLYAKLATIIPAILLVACLGGSLLIASDSTGPKPPVVTQKPGTERPQPTGAAPGPLSAEMKSTHLLLDIKGEGQPVFSPDGKWLAVREGKADKTQLVVVDVVAALKDPKTAHKRYKLAAPQMTQPHSQLERGAVAAFSHDSKQVLFNSPSGLQVLELPPKAEPKALAGAEGFPFLGRTAAGVWPLFTTDDLNEEAQMFEKLLLVSSGKPPAQPPLQPVVRRNAIKWSADGKTLLASNQKGDVVSIDPLSGRETVLVEKLKLETTTGKRFDWLQLMAVNGSDYIVEAHREYPSSMKDMIGTYVPDGDDAPERGSNPGSAEPGPSMPRFAYVIRAGKPTLLQKLSEARFVDSHHLHSSAKFDQHLLVQVANFGSAGRGEPKAWIGLLDAAGKKTEREIPAPFIKGLEAVQLDTVDVSPDGSKALLMASASRIRTFKLAGEKDENGFPAHVSLMLKYKRSGASSSKEGESELTFLSTSFWVADGVKKELRQVGVEFAEKIGEFQAPIVGLDGMIRSHWGIRSWNYNANAGLIAANLSLGFPEEVHPMVLIKVPGW